jgi:hypothetical protein
MLEENDEFYNQNSLRPMNWLIIPKEPARGGEKTKLNLKKIITLSLNMHYK